MKKRADSLHVNPYKKCNAAVLHFLIIIPLLFFGYEIAHGSDLIINGGFEKRTISGVGSSWKDNSKWADVDVEYSQPFDAERKGYVQKIESQRFHRGAVQFVQPGIKLKKNTIYHVRFWAKGKVDSPVGILLRKRGTPYTAYYSRAFRITDQWKEYNFTAPVNVSDASAYFMLKFTSKGMLLVDDVSVTEIQPDENVHVARLGNLLSNGSFEVGLDKWGVNIRGTGQEYEMPIRAQELKPVLDGARQKYGKYSLRIPGEKHSRFLLTSSNIVLTPGIKHSLSLWVYSETRRKIHVSVRSGYFGRGKQYKKVFEVGPKWSRYSLMVELEPAEDDAYFVAVEGSGAGSIWIDAIQIEEDSVTSFKDNGPIEVGFLKDKIHPVFYVGELISIPLMLHSTSGVSDCKVLVTTTDYYGNKTLLQEDDCLSNGVRNRNITIIHSSIKSGYYRLTAEAIVDGKVVSSSQYAIGVVPVLSEAMINEDTPFGMHSLFGPGDLEVARSLGVKWLRMHPPHGTKWSVVEKKKGVFRFYDSEIQAVKDAGFNILGSLDQTPRWASDALEGANRPWAYAPENMDDWENYVYKVVKHYKGVIDYWEVWNEPDTGGFLKIPGFFGDERKPAVYVELLKRAYSAAKRANPDAVIVGGCPTGRPPSRWLAKIFDLGALDYMDIVSFHFYTDSRPGDVLETPTAVDIEAIKKLMRLKIGRTIPIWETESGIMYPKTEYSNLKEISPSYAVPADEAVAYLIRNYIHLIASGVDKWFYYSMFTSRRIDRREATGFFEWDGAPRPLSVAYAVLSFNLNALTYLNTYSVNKVVKATKFSGNDRDLLIVSAKLWGAVSPQTVSLHIDELYSDVSVNNAMGNEIDYIRNGDEITFSVNREPVYVILYKNKLID